MTSTVHDLRIRQAGGIYHIDQAFIVARQGRADEYPDQLADLPGPIGSEQWTPIGEFVDLNEALLLVFILMVEDGRSLRSIDTTLLRPEELERALTQLNQFVVTG